MLDPNVRRLLWYLFAGSKGSRNRIRIIDILMARPSNINQLSEVVGLEYKGVQHHISVLEKNNLITKVGEKYGVLYFISDYLQYNLTTYEEVKSKIVNEQQRIIRGLRAMPMTIPNVISIIDSNIMLL